MSRPGLALLVVSVLVASSSVRAEWPAIEVAPEKAGGGEQDVALVVTIEDYAFLADVPGAEKNGLAWFRWFTQTRALQPDRVKWLKNEAGTPAQIMEAVASLRDKVGQGGTFWFVFVGHGAPTSDASDGVLVGAAAQQTLTELYAQSVTQKKLFDALELGKQAGNVLVIDSCFSGRVDAQRVLSPGAMPTLLSTRPSRLPPNTTLLTAGKSSEFAGPLPAGDRPAFSYLVLGGLRGWADDRTYGDGNGLVTAAEALTYSEAALSATLVGRSQTPQGFGELGRTLARLPKGKSEAGPNLAAIVERQSTRPVEHPDVRVTSGGDRVGGGAGDVGGGSDLSSLDLAALGEAQRLEEAIDRARSLEGDRSASAQSKAEAWEAVAALQVKGSNPYAEEARRNASSWRAVAGNLGELRENWGKLKDALKLSVLDLEKKRSLVGQFLGAYPGLSTEQEYKEAESAKRALDSGNAFPLGGGAVSSGAGSGSGGSSGFGGSSRAPAGLVEIPAGVFTMGSPSSEEGRDADETQREVRITRAFWLKSTEVTQGEWESVMGSNPSSFTSCGKSCPVETVSWEDAVQYLNKLSEREGLERCYRRDGSFKGLRCTGYRLPTEGEWEYAARAGTTGARYGSLDGVAWYEGNSGYKTQALGKKSAARRNLQQASRSAAQKSANAWGLYDMLGNVWEWVHDRYGSYGGNASDPLGPSTGVNRVVRGGSWYNNAGYVRAARRNRDSPGKRFPNLGFRSARSIP